MLCHGVLPYPLFGHSNESRPKNTSLPTSSTAPSSSPSNHTNASFLIPHPGNGIAATDQTLSKHAPPASLLGMALLSTGTFHDAAKAYSKAIGTLDQALHPSLSILSRLAEQSPVDPTLYYKRAIAYFSLGRHANALADFDQVLTLTTDSFEKAHLMKTKIHTNEGRWADAREALKHYQAKNDSIARELLLGVTDGEAAVRKAWCVLDSLPCFLPCLLRFFPFVVARPHLQHTRITVAVKPRWPL